MKFDPIKNPSYVATVVNVTDENLYAVPGLDNLVGYTKFGMQALVSNDTPEGLHLLFSTEVQLSQDFVHHNNLYRDALGNADKTKVGYLEDNRRVKAIRLRQNRSECLLMPLDSLSYLLKGSEIAKLKEGDVFDSIDGVEICRKYVVKEPKANTGQQPKPRLRRVTTKQFPEHTDSESYFRNDFKIPQDGFIVVTQKLHGTSVRYGAVPVTAPQRWWEKALRRQQRADHKFVVGSRRVVKSIDLSAEEGKNDWYADGDLWTRYAATHMLDTRIPKDHIVYGELVGHTGTGSEIQKNYAYGQQDGAAKLYVYRVAVVTTEGRVVDYSHMQMENFCAEFGLTPVPIMWEGLHKDFDAVEWLDRRYYDEWSKGEASFVQPPIPLSHPKTVDEGVCIRYEGPLGTYILKAKSPIFLEMESAYMDQEVLDVEAVAS